MSNFKIVDELFFDKKAQKKWTLKSIQNNKPMLDKLIMISGEIKDLYHVEDALSYEIAIQGINASNGMIDSSSQLLEYFGLKELEDDITDQYKTIYSEVGINVRPVPKIDLLAKYIIMVNDQMGSDSSATDNANLPVKEDGYQGSGFSFFDSL